ncbi:hypothetical protein SAMN05421768_103693 [Chryseobacterium joostei]|uniref:Uncharacterized protein n=2 Tax=Chryseobacterium joostei TaxID=112234 RepID=A0A1N7IB33_9FLAO|nr:hypothetical protein SAMN05421768_103693 [Chryseobacterium joostei]
MYYRAYKMRSNPLNKGRWDLLHFWNKKYNGLFYRSIKAKVNLKEVKFTTDYSPMYMRDIYAIINKQRIIGITKQQMLEAQIRNKPKVRKQIDNIINNGRIR